MSERLGISIEAMLDIAAGLLEDGTDALDKSDIPYWLSAGTALGIYRDGNIIPSDTDIDVSVLDDVSIERIEGAMLNSGFMAQRFRNSKGIPRQRAFIKDGIPFDISIYSSEEDYYIHETPGGFIRKPKHLLDNMHTINFKGKKYPIPDPLKYLRWRYKDWQTPSYDKGVYDESFRNSMEADDELTFKVA